MPLIENIKPARDLANKNWEKTGAVFSWHRDLPPEQDWTNFSVKNPGMC